MSDISEHWSSLQEARTRLEYRLNTLKRLTGEINRDLKKVKAKMLELEAQGG